MTIVGASVRAAAQSAVRAGYLVHAADLFADLDLRAISTVTRIEPFPDGLDAFLLNAPQCSWLYTGALENDPGLVGKMAQSRPLLGNAPDVLRRVRRPNELAAVLHTAGLRFPQTCWDARDLARDGSWLRKPLRSAAGARIVRFTAAVAAEQQPRDCCFQRFVDGLPCSAVYLAAAGRAVLLGATQQLIGEKWLHAGDFRYCGSIGPLALTAQDEHELAHIGAVLAENFGLTGLFGVDAILRDGLTTLEVNPRYTASIEILERGLAIQAMPMHVAACRAGTLPERIPQDRHCLCGKAIVFATRRLRISKIVESLAAESRCDAWPSLADIPIPGTAIEAGWPIATLLDTAENEHQLLEKLRQRAARLEHLVAE